MKSRTDGGYSTGGRRSTSASAYSACSRASPPPVKNDCNVCAASWITRSPSMRPGQPRPSESSRGVNMQSFTCRNLTAKGPLARALRVTRIASWCYAVAMSPRSTVFSGPVEPARPASSQRWYFSAASFEKYRYAYLQDCGMSHEYFAVGPKNAVRNAARVQGDAHVALFENVPPITFPVM